MQKKQTSTHTQPFEWQASSGWLTLLIPDVTHRRVFASVCVSPVINYGPHAGDLLWLLITSQTEPTGGRFSCTSSDSISVWGLVYLHAHTHTHVVVLVHVHTSRVWVWYALRKQARTSNVATPPPLLLISNSAVFCWSLLSIGALMRRVFVLRTISMVFQSSLLTVLEPSPLMKGEEKKIHQRLQILNVLTADSEESVWFRFPFYFLLFVSVPFMYSNPNFTSALTVSWAHCSDSSKPDPNTNSCHFIVYSNNAYWN